VARPTIYRRWPSRQALVVAAVERAFRAANPGPPHTPDVRADLIQLLGNTIDLLAATPVGAVIRALVPELERSPELAGAARALERRRRALLLELLERAASAGRLRPELTPAIALELLRGPIYFRLLVSRDPLERSLAEVLVDAVLG
jgi:AcrR family transcriptional regulator